jgi:hypothetical protein
MLFVLIYCILQCFLRTNLRTNFVHRIVLIFVEINQLILMRKKTKRPQIVIFAVFCWVLVPMLSGYQDSNLGPPAPKAGALAGLRYTPIDLCGEQEIRTLDTLLRYTHFPGVRHRPLGQLSILSINKHGRRDSNSRQLVLETSALPLNYSRVCYFVCKIRLFTQFARFLNVF